MRVGPANAVKIVAVAVMLAVGLWLTGIPNMSVSRPGPTQAAALKSATTPPPSRPLQTACQALRNMAVPVRGIQPGQLTDTFKDARSEGRDHDALDIVAPLNTPVIAAASGKVEKLFVSDAGGNSVYVRSPDGHLIYYYAHLAHYVPALTEGSLLAKGDPIGAVGFTGNANPATPHLHFAIMATTPDKNWWEMEESLNPYPLLVGSEAKAPFASCLGQ